MRREWALLELTLVSLYLLMVVGAYVTTAGYGLECPDWPTCQGQLIPPLTTGVLVEYSHRLLTVLTAVFLFWAAYAVWRMPFRVPAMIRAMKFASILLVIQILLGGVVVGTELNALVAAARVSERDRLPHAVRRGQRPLCRVWAVLRQLCHAADRDSRSLPDWRLTFLEQD